MEFTIGSNEIQYVVIRNSKLAGPRRSAPQWISRHRKTTLTAYPEMNSRDIKKHWYLTLNTSGKNALMRLRSDFRAAVTIITAFTENQEKRVQNQFLFNSIKGGTLPPQVVHGGIGTRSKAGGAHENISLFLFVAVGFVYS